MLSALAKRVGRLYDSILDESLSHPGVQTEVVVGGRSPGTPGVVVIILRPVLVCLTDFLACLLLSQSLS